VAVTVSFTCLAGSAPLTTPCPGPRTLSRNGGAQSVTAVAYGSDGGIATAAVPPINIDQTPPALHVTGATNGAVYGAPGPARLRCAATDGLSGLAHRCKLTVRRMPAAMIWTATATDKAGNVATVQGSAGLIDYYVAGAPKVGRFFQVKLGTCVTLEAFVKTATAPRYMFAAPLGAQPHPVGPPMTRVGTDLWAIRVALTSGLSQERFWTLGVSTGGRVYPIQIELHG
jgi:hypothetical protein